MGSDDLNATITDRIRGFTAPGWVRSVALRRFLAAILVVAGTGVAIVGQREAPSPTALVAARDLMPGQVVSAADVRHAAIPEELMPDDPPSVADVTGTHVTGPVHEGEIIARHRLLGPRLPAALTGDPNARLVPVRPADDASTSFIRAGDRVDLLAEDATVLARDATVALAGQPDETGRPSPVLVAMSASAAHAVAAASLREDITFVLH